MIAGALGTLARHSIDTATRSWLVPRLPDAFGPAGPGLGILLANTLGCAGFGLAFAWFERTAPTVLATPDPTSLHTTARVAVLVGFFGAFTTFSTYAFSILAHHRQGEWLWALITLALHPILGLAAAAIGYRFARGPAPFLL